MRISQIILSKPYTLQDVSFDSFYSQDILLRKEIEDSFQYSNTFQCWLLQMGGIFAKDSVVCNMPFETLAAVFFN